MPSPQTFFAQALPWARQVHASMPEMFVSVVLAQWAEETGYGGYDWAVAHNPGNVGSFDGQPLNMFPSLAVGVQAYMQCLRNGYYTAVLGAGSWSAQCYALGRSPWASAHYEASGPPPGADLVKIVLANNLTQYDGAAPPPPPPPPPTPPPKEENDTVFVIESANLRHVFGVVNNIAYHWWQNIAGPSFSWNVEKLPLA